MDISISRQLRMKIRYRLADDEIIAKCLSFYWVCSITNAMLKRMLGGDISASIISLTLCMSVFAFFIFRAFGVLRRRHKISWFIIPATIYILAFVFSFLRGVPFSPMPLIIVWGILGIFLGTLLISTSNHKGVYKEFLNKIPLFVLLSAPAGLVSTAGEYMMHYSFLLFFPCCICFYAIFEEKKPIYIIPLICFTCFILLYGARGPIVILILFIILYVFKSKGNVSKIIITFFWGTIYLFFKEILILAQYTLEILGVHSRTIMLLIDEPLHDSGRSDIYVLAQKMIDMNPLTGWGVAGERIHMDVYPHNIIYEFLIDFGKPVGCLLLMFMSFILLRGFIKARGYFAFMYTSFLAASFHLLWSGSYLMSTDFWILIYLSIYVNRYKLST